MQVNCGDLFWLRNFVAHTDVHAFVTGSAF